MLLENGILCLGRKWWKANRTFYVLHITAAKRSHTAHLSLFLLMRLLHLLPGYAQVPRSHATSSSAGRTVEDLLFFLSDETRVTQKRSRTYAVRSGCTPSHFSSFASQLVRHLLSCCCLNYFGCVFTSFCCLSVLFVDHTEKYLTEKETSNSPLTTHSSYTLQRAEVHPVCLCYAK